MCSCGLTIIQRRGRHFRSPFHTQARRVKALLAKDCIPISQIASRLGVTTQRLQQITDKLGIKGWARRKNCTLKRRNQRAEGLHPRVEAALRKMRTFGIEATVQATSLRPSATLDVVANGKVCLVRSAFMPKCRPGHVVLATTCPRRPCDFLLFWVRPADMWVVVPSDRYAGKTMFKLELTKQGKAGGGMGHDKRHDWRDYVEAWHLLKGPAQASASGTGLVTAAR